MAAVSVCLRDTAGRRTLMPGVGAARLWHTFGAESTRRQREAFRVNQNLTDDQTMIII